MILAIPTPQVGTAALRRPRRRAQRQAPEIESQGACLSPFVPPCRAGGIAARCPYHFTQRLASEFGFKPPFLLALPSISCWSWLGKFDLFPKASAQGKSAFRFKSRQRSPHRIPPGCWDRPKMKNILTRMPQWIRSSRCDAPAPYPARKIFSQASVPAPFLTPAERRRGHRSAVELSRHR